MNNGIIIYLNGVSSSGKTTLTKALQNKLSEPYYWLANDTFVDMSPDKLLETDWYEAEYQALTMLHNTAKLFSDMGKGVIIDQVLLRGQKGELLNECVDLLQNNPVLFVHVTCSLDELRKREKERGDRNIGQAEGQLALLEPQETYDLTVDTSENATEQCADEIIEFLKRPESFQAFRILRDGRLQ